MSVALGIHTYIFKRTKETNKKIFKFALSAACWSWNLSIISSDKR